MNTWVGLIPFTPVYVFGMILINKWEDEGYRIWTMYGMALRMNILLSDRAHTTHVCTKKLDSTDLNITDM